MKDTITSEQNDNEFAPQSVRGATFHLADETAPAEGFDSMVG